MSKLFIISLLLISFPSFGQEARLNLSYEKIRIGEQISLTLELEYENPKEDALIAWPQFDDAITKYIEIVDRTVDYDELLDSANQIYIRKQQLLVTSFQPGYHLIPSIGIELNDSIYQTNAQTLLVETVEVDTSKGLTDIKPNYQVSYTFSEKVEDWFSKYWPWLAGAGVLAALFFLFRLYKNRTVEEEEVYVPPIPAHITALASLRALEHKEAWKSEEKKAYYSELTYTIRLYLEQRFGINAVEQTTREIIAELILADISETDKDYLRKILSRADMVKFAKVIPTNEDSQESLLKSINFVEKTKKEEDTEDNVG